MSPPTRASSVRLDAATAHSRWEQLLGAVPLSQLVANALADVDGLNLRARPGNATWVCSLWDHFGNYPFDEFRLLPRALRYPCAAAFALARVAFPRRVLQDAWLQENPPLSTPLRAAEFAPDPPPLGWARRAMLSPPPPDSACIGLPSRIVWLRFRGTPLSSDDRADARLDQQRAGEWRPLGEGDYVAAAALYDQLYRSKYSPLNPAFTARFLSETARSGLLDLEGLFEAGRLLGVIGTYQVGEWMTTPVLGYDLSMPRQCGLYRRLTHRITRRAEIAECHLHRSAGAGSFKRLRGATAHLEWVWLGIRDVSVGLRVLRLLARAALATGLRYGL